MEPRYECNCCVCQHRFYASKSIFQTWGDHEHGMGTCPSCKTVLNLTFDPDTNEFITKIWIDFVNERNVANG